MTTKMTTGHIEEAVLRRFQDSYVCVPNIYWGLGFRYEIDILAVNKKTKFATEIEIKASRSDLLADKKKMHKHGGGGRIKYLYFAVPKELESFALKHIPERAGLIVCHFISDWKFPTGTEVVRRPKAATNYRPFSDTEYMKLLELGVLRIQKLKLDMLRQKGKATPVKKTKKQKREDSEFQNRIRTQ